jgi:hypothetical protein
MKLNLTELTKAVSAVAGITTARDQAIASRDEVLVQWNVLADEIKTSQEAVDALTASLIAATTSPAEAVGLAAVATALTPEGS